MPEFTLERTDNIPAKITGQFIGTVSSANYAIPDRETSSKQWFVIDLYRTDARGTYVAHVHYRAGSKLGRENPIDRVVTAADPVGLIAALNAAPITDYVTGWPEKGDPAANRGRDYRSNHANVMEYGESQFAEAIDAAELLLGAKPPVEEIL